MFTRREAFVSGAAIAAAARLGRPARAAGGKNIVISSADGLHSRRLEPFSWLVER